MRLEREPHSDLELAFEVGAVAVDAGDLAEGAGRERRVSDCRRPGD